MQRLSWSCQTQSTTWTFADGLFPLPTEAARITGWRAVLAIGERALAVSPDDLAPLPADRTLRFGDWAEEDPTASGHLLWEPQPVTGSSPSIGSNRTQGARRAPETPRFGLFTVADQLSVSIDTDWVVIGRHPACPVHLDDPRVSHLHCVLIPTAGGIRVIDLRSTNGTRWNGVTIDSVTVCQPGTLSVGDTLLALRPAVDPAERAHLPSPQLNRITETVLRVAKSDAPLLLEGETGVGKDGLATLLHEVSGRDGPLVALNAASISPNIAASELFGHVRGAFTGAEQDHDGAFVAAHGGTLFLDEIGELPLSIQAELLRVVEVGRVRRIGDHRETPVDTRLVTATHRNLLSMIRSGQFREDLFHRICVVHLAVPPLRERLDDLEALTNHFLSQQIPVRKLSPRAWHKLRAHAWPGNLRELINVLRRSCLLSDRIEISDRDLSISTSPSLPNRLDDLIHDTVLRTYDENNGSVADTARQLGIHRATVYRHLKVARRSNAYPAASSSETRLTR